MAIPLALAALATKRNRLIAEREYLQRRIDRIDDAVAKIEGAITVFDEADQLIEVRKQHQENSKLFPHGGTGRTVIKLLWTAPEGLTTTELQYLIAKDRGWLDQPETLRLLSRRVSNALADKVGLGQLVKDGKRDNRIVFRLAKDGEGVVNQKRIAKTKRFNEETRSLRRAQREAQKRTRLTD